MNSAIKLIEASSPKALRSVSVVCAAAAARMARVRVFVRTNVLQLFLFAVVMNIFSP